jgi:hypothetical protein
MTVRQGLLVRLGPLVMLIWVVIACTGAGSSEEAPTISTQDRVDDAALETTPTATILEEIPAPSPVEPAGTPTPIVPSPVEQPRSMSVPLSLTVLAPRDGSTVSASSLQVRGTTSPRAVVSVNGELANIDQSGSFVVAIPLDEGPNLILVIASDSSGAMIERELVVTFEG